MLVLSRKPGEEVWIEPGIQVRVLGIQGRRVRLGFSGPPEILIHREELRKRIERHPVRQPVAPR